MTDKMKRILIISTGGTMGMQVAGTGKLDAGHFIQEIFQYAPDVRKIAHIDLESPFMLDSSDIGIPQWEILGRLLFKHMDSYDGFVILHGTDTMSYTASALSYMLVNLPKPVVLTGSQRPLAALRTDARGNLVGAVELATKSIPEVCVYFANKLFRGNRTKKLSIDGFDAFFSPNYPPLATVGLHIERGAVHRKPTGLVRFESAWDERVVAITAFPSINPEYWKHLLNTDVQVVILSAFGAGNVPVLNAHFLDFLGALSTNGKQVIVCSQSPEGNCDLELYEGGQALARAGAISAGDMTFEATLVKAMFLLGLFGGDLQRLRNHFHFSIAGEISDENGSLLV